MMHDHLFDHSPLGQRVGGQNGWSFFSVLRVHFRFLGFKDEFSRSSIRVVPPSRGMTLLRELVVSLTVRVPPSPR